MTSLSLIFAWILAATLRTSILVLAILIVQRLLRSQLSPKWRYALWLPALAAILIPAQPLLPHWVRLSPEQRRESSTIESSTTAVTVNVAPDDNDLDRHSRSSDSIPSATSSIDRIVENKTNVETGIPIWPETRTSTASEEIEASEAHAEVEPAWTDVTQPRSWDWRALAVGVWLLGVALLGAIVPISYWLTLRRVRRSVMPVEPSNLAHVELLVRKLGLRRVPRVWLSPVVQTPAVCGLWRPVLLLNADFFQALTHEEADFVLRHELIHIRRGDLLLNTFLCILLVLHWFNPLLWYAFFRVRADREAACDDDVLRGEEPARRVAYGTTLLKMETMFRESGLCLGFVGMLNGNNCLRDRIRFISNPMSIGASMKSLLSICMVLATILGIAKASEPQQNTAKPLPKVSKADGLEPWQTDLTEFFDHLQDVTRGGKTPDRQYFVDGILRGTDSWAIPTTHTYGKNRELKVFDGFVDLKPKDGTVQWSLNQALKGRSVKWAFEVAKAKVIKLDEAAAGDKDVKWILELVPHYDDNGDQFSRKLPVTRLSTIRVAIPHGESAIPKLTAGDRVRVEGTIGDYAANQGVQLADFTGPIVVYKRKDEAASLQTTVSIGLQKAKVTTTQAARSFKIRKLSSVPTINKYDKHTRAAVSIDQKSVLARVPDGERSGRAGILFKQRYGVYLSSLDAKDPKRTRLGDPYFGFVPKSNLAYLVSWGDGVQFWDTRTHTRSGDYIPHELREDTTIGPALSPSGKLMVTRSQLDHLQFWNIETRKPITKEIKQAGTVYGMGFSSDGKWFFSRTPKRLAIWDPKTGSVVAGPLRHDMKSFAYSPKNDQVVTFQNNAREEEVWSSELVLRSGKAFAAVTRIQLEGHAREAMWIGDTNLLVVGDNKAPGQMGPFSFGRKIVYLISLASDKPESRTVMRHDWISKVAVAPDQRHFMTTTRDNTSCWQVGQSKPLWTQPGDQRVTFGDNGWVLLHNGPAIAYSLADGKELWRMENVEMARAIGSQIWTCNENKMETWKVELEESR